MPKPKMSMRERLTKAKFSKSSMRRSREPEIEISTQMMKALGKGSFKKILLRRATKNGVASANICTYTARAYRDAYMFVTVLEALRSHKTNKIKRECD